MSSKILTAFYSLGLLSFFVLILLVVGCGDPPVVANIEGYKPKFIVEAFINRDFNLLYGKISRNYPMQGSSVLWKGLDSIVVKFNGKEIELTDSLNFYVELSTLHLDTINTLSISGYIDGLFCQTSAKTRLRKGKLSVPKENLGRFHYGDFIAFDLTNTSDGSFYVLNNYIPERAFEKANFIEENPYFTWDDFQNAKNVIIANIIPLYQVIPGVVKKYQIQIPETFTWFYSMYFVEIYSGDENFKNYMLTSKTGMEFDGSSHPVVSSFEGDGFGIFTSISMVKLSYIIIR